MSKASRAYLALSENAIDQIQKLGRDIAVARKRRYISMSEMAERMMVNPKTVQRLEEGDPAVGLGIVATALWVLGLHRRLGDLVAPESDSVALQQDISNLPRDFRKSKNLSDKFDF
jgi:transcriptional regulator with XRE-family HTH domain